MMQLNVVHVDTRKILFCNNFQIILDNFEKKWWQNVLNFTTTETVID